MLLRGARSGTDRVDRPSPQNSTNLSTTPGLRSISVSRGPGRVAGGWGGGVRWGVALGLVLEVGRVGVSEPEGIDLYRVVDEGVDGHERIDFAGVLARALHRRSHRWEVHDRRYAGEVLHQNA